MTRRRRGKEEKGSDEETDSGRGEISFLPSKQAQAQSC